MRASGALSFEEFAFVLETILTSKEYPVNINTIWDLREADFSSVDSQFWERIIEYRKEFTERNNCRSAMIVSKDLQYGMSRMFEITSEGNIPQQVRVFRDFSEGENWILETNNQ